MCVSTCIRSPRPNTRGTADASVAGRAGGTLLASAMAALDALGGSCGCRTLGGTSDDIASARLDGRETADARRAGGGLGILFANRKTLTLFRGQLKQFTRTLHNISFR